MEAFEITFFCFKNKYDITVKESIEKSLEELSFLEKNVLLEFFQEEKKDYIELQISIFELIVTKNNFIYFFSQIAAYIGNIFSKIDSIQFATGIYELTYHFIEHRNHLSQFDAAFLKNFPIVFLRSPQKLSGGRTIFENENIICIFHENAQVIY